MILSFCWILPSWGISWALQVMFLLSAVYIYIYIYLYLCKQYVPPIPNFQLYKCFKINEICYFELGCGMSLTLSLRLILLFSMISKTRFLICFLSLGKFMLFCNDVVLEALWNKIKLTGFPLAVVLRWSMSLSLYCCAWCTSILEQLSLAAETLWPGLAFPFQGLWAFIYGRSLFFTR